MTEIIESANNKKLKLLKSLAAKKSRDKTGLFVVEGKRMAGEAVEYALSSIEFAAVSRSFAEENKILVKSIDELGISVYTIKDNLFNQVSNTVTPQGISIVMKGGSNAKVNDNMSEFNRVLVLDGVSEPGNLGTIIRTAEAAGIERVYMMKGCADIYNPKVVRSTMGSIFRVRFVRDCDIQAVRELKENGFEIAASSLGESIDVYKYAESLNKNTKRAIVIGSEAFGVSVEVLSLADVCVHIPMQGKVESLNAAVAAGILMYML